MKINTNPNIAPTLKSMIERLENSDAGQSEKWLADMTEACDFTPEYVYPKAWLAFAYWAYMDPEIGFFHKASVGSVRGAIVSISGMYLKLLHGFEPARADWTQIWEQCNLAYAESKKGPSRMLESNLALAARHGVNVWCHKSRADDAGQFITLLAKVNATVARQGDTEAEQTKAYAQRFSDTLLRCAGKLLEIMREIR